MTNYQRIIGIFNIRELAELLIKEKQDSYYDDYDWQYNPYDPDYAYNCDPYYICPDGSQAYDREEAINTTINWLNSDIYSEDIYSIIYYLSGKLSEAVREKIWKDSKINVRNSSGELANVAEIIEQFSKEWNRISNDEQDIDK